MSGSRASRPIAGNTRDGRLYTTGRPDFYEGERRVVGGRFERRQFKGHRAAVMAAWQSWQLAGLEAANIHVVARKVASADERGKKTGDEIGGVSFDATTERKVCAMDAKEEVASMYVLTFRGRSQKDVALFADGDKALRMAESLSVALDVSGAEGEYDVAELPVWG